MDESPVRALFAAALLFMSFGYSTLALAGREVTLFIWLDDGKIQDPTFELSRQNLEKSLSADSLRTLFLTEKNVGALSAQTLKALKPGDEIQEIILIGHGNTWIPENLTNLGPLGTIGPKGTTGPLHEFFKNVGPQLSQRLKITLGSCHTACGTEAQLLERVEGLRLELSRYGVRDLLFWGSRDAFAPYVDGKKSGPQKLVFLSSEYGQKMKASKHEAQILKSILFGSTTALAGIAMHSYPDFNIAQMPFREFLSALSWGPAVGFTVYTYHHLKDQRVQYFTGNDLKIGTRGYLVRAGDEGSIVVSMDVTDPQSLGRLLDNCEVDLKNTELSR